MKKIFTLITALVACIAVSAQQSYTWDFTKGFSESTKANLKADATNWTTNRTDATTGEVTGWKNASVQTDYLYANGAVIPELEGLKFSGYKAGHILLDPTSIRVGTTSQKITLPKMYNGQHLTVVARSANSTATNRALVSYSDELTNYDGPAGGYCLGSQAEGASEDGNYTLTWECVTDNEEGVELTFGTGSESGGIDIKSIKISGGTVDEAKSVAYIYSGELDADMYYIMRPSESAGFTWTDIPQDAVISTDSLRAFDAVVIAPSVTEGSAMATLAASQIAFVPMVNLNTSLFGYATAGAELNLTAVNASDDIFAGISVDAETKAIAYSTTSPVGVTLPERFAEDAIIAYAGEAVAIHQHTPLRNSYILLPSPADFGVDLDAWSSMLSNALSIVCGTKRTVQAAATPAYAMTYANGTTTVALTCSTSGATITYSVDGGEPQTYTEPLSFTSAATITASAIAEGYEKSAESTKTVDIQAAADAPVINVTTADGVATVTITAAEGATIKYNFRGSAVETESSTYTEPFTVSENCTVTAFVPASESMLASDIASQAVVIEGYTPMKAVISHFDANKAEYSNGESKAFYYCYLNPNLENKKSYALSENYTVQFCPEGGEWMVETSGQQVVWESTGPKHNIGDATDYNPISALDDIDNEATAGEITIGSTASTTQIVDGEEVSVKDDPSAAIVSTKAFQAPFDVVVYVGGKNAEVDEVSVSADGQTWFPIGKVAIPMYEDTPNKSRCWCRNVISYKGTDQVYVRVAACSTSTNRIFDIFVKGPGEADAIAEVAADAPAKMQNDAIYNIAGQRISSVARPGIYIQNGRKFMQK